MLVRRNPISRVELHRERVNTAPRFGSSGTKCSWCDGGALHLYRFWYESNGGTKSPIKRLFCSNACFRSYHG